MEVFKDGLKASEMKVGGFYKYGLVDVCVVSIKGEEVVFVQYDGVVDSVEEVVAECEEGFVFRKGGKEFNPVWAMMNYESRLERKLDRHRAEREFAVKALGDLC